MKKLTITILALVLAGVLSLAKAGSAQALGTCDPWDLEPSPPDGDVDGSDLAFFARGSIVDLEGFASAFGKSDCSTPNNPDLHHILYSTPIPDISVIPFPDIDDDGVADKTYSCISCHGKDFALERDCIVCHGGMGSDHLNPSDSK